MRCLIISLLISCQTITVGTNNLQIYTDHRQDYLFIKFSSEEYYMNSNFEFYTCSEPSVTIISDPKEDIGFLRQMIVVINEDTIYNGWQTKHEIEIDLIKGKWSNL